MNHLKYISIFFIALSVHMQSFGQSLPVGTPAFYDYYRRSQLMGELDPRVSFTVNPIYSSRALQEGNAFYIDSVETGIGRSSANSWTSADGKFNGTVLPASLQVQLNSHHPSGWNDGAMIPAKGLQTLISGGFYAQYGPLSIQLMPELVYASNPTFDTFNEDHYDVIAARYYDFYNNIDLPARFGKTAYTRAYLGQSSIRLNVKSLSLGLSSENLWWGPGRKNSLLMSNTAPGFMHLTLNTLKPISSPIGSFEGQLIAGRLEGSGFGVLEPEREYFYNPLFIPKPDDWRYLSGIVLTWQPKWVPGLFLGMTRSSQLYHDDLNSFGDYLPFFSSVKKVKADDPIADRDVRSSLFMRWLWKEEHAEIYFEFGRDNYNGDARERLLEADRSRAYTFGLRKIFPFNESRGENFIVNVEVSQLQETSMEDIRAIKSWYISKQVRHGYTHRGQLLGAGIGPGGNMQSLNVSWFKGLKRLGFEIERYVHSNDFYYYAYEDSKDYRRHWTDLSFAAVGEWNYKNFIFNAKVQALNSLNYQWYLFQGPEDEYMVKGDDAFNLQLKAGMAYRF